MFNLGFSEMLVVAALALIFIGPEQLPQVARTVAKLLNEWKRASSQLYSSLQTNVDDLIQEKKENTPAPTAESKELPPKDNA